MQLGNCRLVGLGSIHVIRVWRSVRLLQLPDPNRWRDVREFCVFRLWFVMICCANSRKNSQLKTNKNNKLHRNNVIYNQPVAGSIPIASSKNIKASGANLRSFLLPIVFWLSFA